MTTERTPASKSTLAIGEFATANHSLLCSFVVDESSVLLRGREQNFALKSPPIANLLNVSSNGKTTMQRLKNCFTISDLTNTKIDLKKKI